MNRRRVVARGCGARGRGARRVVSFGGLRSRNRRVHHRLPERMVVVLRREVEEPQIPGLETRHVAQHTRDGLHARRIDVRSAATSTITPTAVRLPNGTTARRPTSASDASSN